MIEEGLAAAFPYPHPKNVPTPLSSQGLLNALFTGLAAAETADSHLRGDVAALDRYRDTIAGIATAYRRHLALWYGMEQRWPASPFWKRRHGNID